MNLDHDFVQVSKLSEDQKKSSSLKREHFFPQIQVRTKKKVFTKSGTLFSPNSSGRPTLRCTLESNYWGDADVDHTQTIGGDTVKLLGGIYPPHPPRVLAPLLLVKVHVLFVCFCSVPSIFSLFLQCIS